MDSSPLDMSEGDRRLCWAGGTSSKSSELRMSTEDPPSGDPTLDDELVMSICRKVGGDDVASAELRKNGFLQERPGEKEKKPHDGNRGPRVRATHVHFFQACEKRSFFAKKFSCVFLFNNGGGV